MVSRIVEITNKSGLHVRPAARLSKAAEHCTSKVEIVYEGAVINAKSLLNIVSKAIARGTKVELRCTGANEEQDLDYMTEAFQNLE
mgnify:FL=1